MSNSISPSNKIPAELYFDGIPHTEFRNSVKFPLKNSAENRIPCYGIPWIQNSIKNSSKFHVPRNSIARNFAETEFCAMEFCGTQNFAGWNSVDTELHNTEFCRSGIPQHRILRNFTAFRDKFRWNSFPQNSAGHPIWAGQCKKCVQYNLQLTSEYSELGDIQYL